MLRSLISSGYLVEEVEEVGEVGIALTEQDERANRKISEAQGVAELLMRPKYTAGINT